MRERERPEPIPVVGRIEDLGKSEREVRGEAWTPVINTSDEVKALKDRISGLEYGLSAVQLQCSQLLQLVAERLEDNKESEGWREIYRVHNPEIKGFGVTVTTQERREGHVVERGYSLELRDVEGEEPRLRIRRLKDVR